MASQELGNARESATDNLKPGIDNDAAPGTNKSCPVHAPSGEETKRGFRKGMSRHNDYVKITVPESKVNRLPAEWWKTVIAFFYAAFNLVLTTVVITVVHERWAFAVTEINGMLLVAIWMIQLFFFKYKSIVFRRFFFLIGTLYLYRCVTMYITTLPVPGVHMTCAPKLYGDSQAKLQRILRLMSGGGLSMTNSHLLCGDFLYSGHTVMLTLTYLFIKELLWVWSASWWPTEHYSVDVVVAYFITSRLFWWYHTMANLQTLKCSPNNYLTNTWWNPLFNFLERNVQTSVPCSFVWPLSWPSVCLKNPCKKYSMTNHSPPELGQPIGRQ
ncbi:Phosphatidylcholine:ceramide cholinephosphotransferase 2 [Oryzias melastigma]|uniref:Phosphatidylcholine:ceramide cholinephosphotransferase 2 n=1 Tax=Oryzias melastigma TaxID=30732 RepID=A0A834FQZ9_ORYME|nr:Phosphatidylcholine:ceramide cholinephosphotransferase 2 [Oryzias melastigma]